MYLIAFLVVAVVYLFVGVVGVIASCINSSYITKEEEIKNGLNH